MLVIWLSLTLLGALILPVAARAEDAASQPPLEETDAFDKAYAASYYQFDACGDGLAGRIYRKALVERMGQCPFTAAAKARFRARSAAQRRRSSEAIEELIEVNGGLPVRLEGMTRTCREQMDSPEYRIVRDRLESYSSGKSGSETVITAPCAATQISP